jgi:hypothetical protein
VSLESKVTDELFLLQLQLLGLEVKLVEQQLQRPFVKRVGLDGLDIWQRGEVTLPGLNRELGADLDRQESGEQAGITDLTRSYLFDFDGALFSHHVLALFFLDVPALPLGPGGALGHGDTDLFPLELAEWHCKEICLAVIVIGLANSLVLPGWERHLLSIVHAHFSSGTVWQSFSATVSHWVTGLT